MASNRAGSGTRGSIRGRFTSLGDVKLPGDTVTSKQSGTNLGFNNQPRGRHTTLSTGTTVHGVPAPSTDRMCVWFPCAHIRLCHRRGIAQVSFFHGQSWEKQHPAASEMWGSRSAPPFVTCEPWGHRETESQRKPGRVVRAEEMPPTCRYQERRVPGVRKTEVTNWGKKKILLAPTPSLYQLNRCPVRTGMGGHRDSVVVTSIRRAARPSAWAPGLGAQTQQCAQRGLPVLRAQRRVTAPSAKCDQLGWGRRASRCRPWLLH